MTLFLRCVLACVLLIEVCACGDDAGSAESHALPGTLPPAGTVDTTNWGSDAGPAPPTPDGEGDSQSPIPDDTGSTVPDTTLPVTDACNCDDGDPCTEDSCLADGACTSTPLAADECGPQIGLDVPARGASLLGSGPVLVEGHVQAPSGLATLTLNGNSLLPGLEGSQFQQSVPVKHGLNIFRAEMSDQAGEEDRAVQTALVGEAYYPLTLGDNPQAGVPNGLVVYLGAEFWDDDDLSDSDDLATFATQVLSTINLASALAGPLGADGEGPGFLWCEYTVHIQDVSYAVDSVELVPVQGGVSLVATLKNLYVAFSAVDETFLCVDGVGTATSAEVTVEAVLWLQLAGGQFQVTPDQVTVSIAAPSVDFTEGVASLFDWFVNLFDTVIAGTLEAQAESLLTEQIAPLIQQVLDNLIQDGLALDAPSLLEVTNPVSLTFGVSPGYLSATAQGLKLGFDVRISAPKGATGVLSPGSLARNGCLDGDPQGFVIPTSAPIVMGLHDDLLNQLLFSMWWGGALHVTVPPHQVAAWLQNVDVNVSEVEVTLAPMLPPVVTSCHGAEGLELQLGDVWLDLDFLLAGQPASTQMYLSARVRVVPTAVLGPEGEPLIALAVTQLTSLEHDIVTLGGLFEGQKQLLENLLSTVVVEMLVSQIASGFVGSFPMPGFEVGGVIPGVPTGTTIGFTPASVTRKPAHTLLFGHLSE